MIWLIGFMFQFPQIFSESLMLYVCYKFIISHLFRFKLLSLDTKIYKVEGH